LAKILSHQFKLPSKLTPSAPSIQERHIANLRQERKIKNIFYESQLQHDIFNHVIEVVCYNWFSPIILFLMKKALLVVLVEFKSKSIRLLLWQTALCSQEIN